MRKIRVSAADRRAKAKSEAARGERLRLAAAEKVFLEYQGESEWAFYKLKSGTAPLTAESVRFMQDELDLRKRRATYNAKIKAELDAEKPPANPVGETK